MKVNLSRSAEKDFKRLPQNIKEKVLKQLAFLENDIFYPSLKTKKKQGHENVWEARIDYHYRFTFQKEDDTLTIRKFGPHDEGLEKK